MKYLERAFYRGYWHFGNGSSMTIKSWLAIKDRIFCAHKRVAKRHRRSIAQRDLHRLFPRYKIKSYNGYSLRVSVVFLKTADGLAMVDSPRLKASIWEPCHRLIWKNEGVK